MRHVSKILKNGMYENGHMKSFLTFRMGYKLRPSPSLCIEMFSPLSTVNKKGTEPMQAQANPSEVTPLGSH